MLGIFNERQRPFFQSAINYKLDSLPCDKLSQFVSDMFKGTNKTCDLSQAELISNMVRGHPYYAQKLAFFTYENSGEVVKKGDIDRSFEDLLKSEQPVFEAIIQGLAPKQVAMLKAIALEPSASLFSIGYMKRHGLGSTGGVQGALKRLLSLDIIEREDEVKWSVVDPIFSLWLKKS